MNSKKKQESVTMESKAQNINVACGVCGKTYTVKLDAEILTGDELQRLCNAAMRSIQQKMIDRKKCDECIEQEEAAELERQRQVELAERLRTIPFSMGFDRIKTPDKGVLAEWTWTNRNNHLWIAGDYGCGKTRALCNTLGLLTKQGRKCRYITCNDLLSKYGHKSQKFGKLDADDWLESLLKCDILAIDDIGKKRISLSGGEALYNLLDYRYSGRGKAIVYLTANLSGGEIARKFEDADTGAAFRSRLLRLEFLPWNMQSANEVVKDD
jgi:DNA replication protein DnaC